jgi:hypothetical protein
VSKWDFPVVCKSAETIVFRLIPPETKGGFRFSGSFRPSDYSVWRELKPSGKASVH